MDHPPRETAMKPTSLAATLLLLVISSAARADDALSTKVLRELKAATAFIQLKGDRFSGSGSGFIARTDDTATYLVTNHHVVATEKAVEEEYTYLRGGRRF